jgi:hypothetical protein
MIIASIPVIVQNFSTERVKITGSIVPYLPSEGIGLSFFISKAAIDWTMILIKKGLTYTTYRDKIT